MASRISSTPMGAQCELSLVQGPSSPPLWTKTLGEVVAEQEARFGNRVALIIPWQNVRLTYRDLAHRSKAAAKAMLDAGLRHGDCVGIFAGNCHQYLELFLATARIGCPYVVLNNTYSPEELLSAVVRSDCKLLFVASAIGSRSLSHHVEKLVSTSLSRPGARMVQFGNASLLPSDQPDIYQSYASFLARGSSGHATDAALDRAEQLVRSDDILNLQFTSGTTGLPKAAKLTHSNLINNGRFVGQAMHLTEEDIVCCPCPLFHCFGLVMGFLASFVHGSSIIFPSAGFNATATLDAIVQEKATVLLGVPTMFVAELEELEQVPRQLKTIRAALAGGSSVPPALLERLRSKMSIGKTLTAYGMTETSPVTFITSLEDTDDKMLNTFGRAFPHTGLKIIDGSGNIVPRGVRGEICTSGFALQKGYWKDEVRTCEVMKRDEHGIIWMHTGDEGFLDDEDYGHITGRIKDLIIRGGENLSPSEIENRLLRHSAIAEACVVGATDHKYGEVVAAFLKPATNGHQLSDQEIRSWVLQELGRVKVPEHVFWLDGKEAGEDLPKTGSGKFQKHLIRAIANKLVKARKQPQAKL
ncbi:4-coumarate-CoA ligase [Thozetella sp. PMI_491]|nr:4-coumarate-CoA ligase [Thozetella sp. PMI_491]